MADRRRRFFSISTERSGATKDLRQTTRVASFMGSMIAFGLVGLGILTVFWGGRFIEGLLLGLIGWFLLVAARHSVSQVELKDSLKHLRVSEAVQSTCPQVPDHLLLDHLVDEFVFRGGGKCFFVTEGDLLKGLVTLDDVRQVNRDEWSRTTVGDVTVPFTAIKSVSPRTRCLRPAS